MNRDPQQVSEVPAHVPAELVSGFSLVDWPGMNEDPHGEVARLHGGPRIFWTTRDHRGVQPGSWVITRAEDIRFVMQNPQLFSNQGLASLSALINESWKLIPDELDPPEHTKYRALLNPMFAPGPVSKMTQDVRLQAVALIQNLTGTRGCEFMESFAKPFPVSIFLRLMGLPLEQMDTFLKWEADALHSETMEPKIAAIRAIHDRLVEAIEERRREPRGDLISAAIQARIDGQPLTQSELVGFGVMMFLAGLDTVSSALGLFFKHLAQHPEQQADLRERPERIASAVEEMLRAFPVVTTNRRATQDVQLGGVQIKAGDWVTIQTSSATLDPAEHADPRRIDFDRRNKTSGVFAYGPHRCLGSHLARLELRIALEEWVSRLPPFHIRPGSKPLLHGGSVFGVDRLELEW